MEEKIASADFENALINAMRDPFIVLDKELRIRNVNTAFYKTFGGHQNEFVGELLFECGDNQWNIPELRALLKKVILDNTPFSNLELKREFPFTGQRLLIFRISQVKINKGGEHLILLNIEDNTDIKKAAILSSEKEQIYRSAFDNALLGIMQTDLKGRILRVNQAFCKITGYSETELLKKPHLSMLHSDDKKSYEDSWKNLLKEGHAFVKENQYRCKFKKITWVRNSVSLLKDPEGRPQGFLIICVDIHEEKRAEEKAEEIAKRFRFLADSMPQQIWTADAAGNLNYFSQAFYTYTGLSFDEIKNSNWANIVYPEDSSETDALWKNSVAKGEEFLIEHRLKNRDGKYKWQLSRAMAQKDNQGKILMWVGATTNIHNQKMLEEKLEKQVLERTIDLREANFNLKHSNHDLEQFAYIATHDLQEPLRKIRTYSSWINKDHKNELSAEAKDYMSKIENASERMAKLIDDLLNYSILLRPQEAFEITDLNFILDHIIEDFDLLIKEKKAIIHKSKLPAIKAVTMQMNQLFYNLLGNALKFTKDKRQPVIKITTRKPALEELVALQLDIDVTYVEIIFSDNGIGFHQEYEDKVFAIFQRLNTRRKFPGTGIGLALCQKIVLYHHGQIYVKAKENDGASFHIFLPSSA